MKVKTRRTLYAAVLVSLIAATLTLLWDFFWGGDLGHVAVLAITVFEILFVYLGLTVYRKNGF